MLNKDKFSSVAENVLNCKTGIYSVYHTNYLVQEVTVAAG